MKIQESGENYLETILILKSRLGYVRAIDVATELGFSKPSVSRAMGILKADGYITVESNGNICLTKEGFAMASSVYDRHVTITRYLSEVLGVNEAVAEADACRIEHIISAETFSKIKEAMAARN
jgi:Mn-dependent DtxR family transcriptional regulator